MDLIDPRLEALVAEQREYISNLQGPFAPPPDPMPELLPAQTMTVAGNPPVKIRVMRPEGLCRAVYLQLHGGGFMHGDAAMGDITNSYLARNLGLACVAVDYRLAPEHPYPAAVEDCLAVALWLIEEGKKTFGTERLLIGGQSVGASLSVMTLLRLREWGQLQQRFSAVNLEVGNYDFSMTPSQRLATDEHFLSPEHLAEMRTATFPGLSAEQLRNAAISTLYADLESMPPALFSIGTADAVLDDSLFMAMRWQAAGNSAELAVYPEGPHLFMTYPTQMAEKAKQRIVAFLDRYAGITGTT